MRSHITLRITFLLFINLAQYANSDCLVDDMILQEGESAGHIGLECISSSSYIGLEGICINGTISELEKEFDCSTEAGVQHCVQNGPRGWGAALCLDSDDSRVISPTTEISLTRLDGYSLHET